MVLAVNNVPVTSERQLNKLLSGTSSELSVLVDRMIYEKGKTLHSMLNSNGRFLPFFCDSSVIKNNVL